VAPPKAEAGLARYDGRLSVLTARSQDPLGLWTVVLRDHVRHTWLRLRRIEQLTPDEQGGAPLVPWERPLVELEPPTSASGAAMPWLEVLWALDALEHSAQDWCLVAIEASRPGRTEPRYRLVLQRTGTAEQRPVDSYTDFKRLVIAG
jgi:hypothetical protein